MHGLQLQRKVEMKNEWPRHIHIYIYIYTVCVVLRILRLSLKRASKYFHKGYSSNKEVHADMLSLKSHPFFPVNWLPPYIQNAQILKTKSYMIWNTLHTLNCFQEWHSGQFFTVVQSPIWHYIDNFHLVWKKCHIGVYTKRPHTQP